jgi:tetratricopeptide (TPR) repeat protein
MTDAIARFTQLLEKHPNNELARFSLGKAYFDLQQFAPAKVQLELALARKPDWMIVQILIGKCELALGHRAPALAAFERARRLATDQNHEGPLAEVDQLLAELQS